MGQLMRTIAVVLALLVPFAACSSETHTGKDSTHDGWFEGSFDDALQQARASSKLVFVDFFTTWCPPCKKLEQVTFPDPAVKAELAKMVSLSIDAESPAGQPLARRYDVTGYPTLLVLAPDGREVGRIVGFKEPATLVRLLEEIRAREKR